MSHVLINVLAAFLLLLVGILGLLLVLAIVIGVVLGAVEVIQRVERWSRGRKGSA